MPKKMRHSGEQIITKALPFVTERLKTSHREALQNQPILVSF
jgi:hypothetical protein